MRRVLFPLLLLAATANIYAQGVSGNSPQTPYSSTQKRYTFAMQPMQRFNEAWRFDFEMRLGDGPGWLQFGPALYAADPYENDGNPRYYYDGNNYYFERRHYYSGSRGPYSKLRGGGLDINYKHFIDSRRAGYFATGLSYTHFKIDYWGYKWENFREDGLPYHAYVLDYRTQHINRLGFNAFWGRQAPKKGAFIFDVFGGLSYRHSFSEKNKPAFNDTMLSFGYTGFVFIAGFRIGFGLR